MKLLYKFIWWLVGWKIIGDVPKDEKKYIIIAAPHTSNWDFLIGISMKSIVDFDSKFLGKKTLFRPPFGWFFRMMGGYPVDRSKKSNVVDQVVGIFNRHEEFIIAIAPEGTRGNVNEWKTGFYHIANGAQVPIVRMVIDRRKKQVEIFSPFYTTGDFITDMIKIKEVYF
jgi:1-acyl-sn-glycerol-3-phosphate acyltransferase